MQVRTPTWDFTGLKAHWSPNAEFAQAFNASSTIPAYVEPYLLKVMRKAKAQLGPEHAALHERIDWFNRQEMQHFRQHAAFNAAIRADGYEGMAEIEKDYEADYERFLATKSLRFNLAYVEGFEAMSAIGVTNWFEEYDQFIAGADPRPVEVWRWHLAEEYEHREVAHDVFHALYGRNPISFYAWRIYGFFYAVKHIRAHSTRILDYLLETDRKSMTPEDVAASDRRMAEVNAANGKRAREHLLDILSPWYRPSNRRPPRGLLKLLETLSAPAAPVSG